jgi:hypothetical protein
VGVLVAATAPQFALVEHSFLSGLQLTPEAIVAQVLFWHTLHGSSILARLRMSASCRCCETKKTVRGRVTKRSRIAASTAVLDLAFLGGGAAGVSSLGGSPAAAGGGGVVTGAPGAAKRVSTIASASSFGISLGGSLACGAGFSPVTGSGAGSGGRSEEGGSPPAGGAPAVLAASSICFCAESSMSAMDKFAGVKTCTEISL